MQPVEIIRAVVGGIRQNPELHCVEGTSSLLNSTCNSKSTGTSNQAATVATEPILTNSITRKQPDHCMH